MAISCNRLALSARAPNSNEIIAGNGFEQPERQTLLTSGTYPAPRIVEEFEREVEVPNNKIDWSKGWWFDFRDPFVENRF